MMEPIFEQLPEAHLRYLEWDSHCTLTFKLEVPESDKYEEINENIVALRRMTENVQALLVHTNNKIQKLFKNKLKEKKENLEEEMVPVDLMLSLNNKRKAIPGGTELKAIQRFKRMKFSILGHVYKVIVNSPLVENIKLPDVIYSGHAVQPSTLKAILADHEKSKYFWYKSMDKENWEQIGFGYHYNVALEDIAHYIKFKCVPINIYGEGLPYEVVSECKVCKTPEVPYCPFEDRQKETSTALTGNEFRVVSYNTLSCRYANDQFAYCPVEYIAIDYRKQLLLKELIGYNADILCCQEVDNKIYSFYFRPEFQKLNFGSIYNKKGNRIPEGLAIFYNKSRFGVSFSGQGQIVFNNEIKTNRALRNISQLINSDTEACETFMKQPSSMQYLLVKSKNNNQVVIIANTHLYYHPDANNVRLLQAAVSLEYLKGIYYHEIKKKNVTQVCLLFCGDFNSTPDSDVYKFIMHGAIQYNSKSINTSLFHTFQFTSACDTPKFTNYTDDFKACLDYIFIANLTCTKHVEFPKEEILKQDTALPSPVFPSDHLALIADLKFN